ncbi:MAG: peptidase M19 [Pseudozobellia sp.]|nr:peptidase M19 [Pseudozobellia sp.]MBG49893.1 peptidase M19 [Pseudozobellia sp.]|tara:strand:- start:5393 stop:6562 length:1170 start_codon:yes stop_codon:yes gene_type:complete
MKKKTVLIVILVLTLTYIAVITIVPKVLDKKHNQTQQEPPYTISNEALEFYNSLDFVSDLHCDALLWSRDLTKKNDVGHVDFPRMQDANMALQAFTIVTKSPAGQNFSKNSSDAFDNITLLNIVQGKPLSNWNSLFKRAEYQCQKLQEYADDFDGNFILVENQKDFEHLLNQRKNDRRTVGGFLGVEGGHCLEGNLENLDKLYEEGLRMLGPTHFFDNELGGSAHGISEEGLTDFGRQVIDRMNELGMFIDLAHAAPAMIDDILSLTDRPLIVSHTGVKGTMNNSRNLSDGHIKKIARNGGLIGIAFFKGAVSSPEIQGIVDAMKHVKSIAGIDCIALGSDYDGSATLPFDVTGMPLLVEELMAQGFSENEMRAILGENVKRFMLANLK